MGEVATTRPEMEAAIRVACQKAHGQTKAAVRIDLEEDCGLADVLAALGNDYAANGKGEIFEIYWVDGCEYNIKTITDWHLPSNLSNQPDATVSALYGITSGKGNE